MGSYMQVLQDTPGSNDNCIGYLGLGNPTMVINGPGTFRVFRCACTTAVGAFSET
jgi:acetone carboxylase gamma subunit